MLGLEVDAGVANIEKRLVGMKRCVETNFGDEVLCHRDLFLGSIGIDRIAKTIA